MLQKRSTTRRERENARDFSFFQFDVVVVFFFRRRRLFFFAASSRARSFCSISRIDPPSLPLISGSTGRIARGGSKRKKGRDALRRRLFVRIDALLDASPGRCHDSCSREKRQAKNQPHLPSLSFSFPSLPPTNPSTTTDLGPRHRRRGRRRLGPGSCPGAQALRRERRRFFSDLFDLFSSEAAGFAPGAGPQPARPHRGRAAPARRLPEAQAARPRIRCRRHRRPEGGRATRCSRVGATRRSLTHEGFLRRRRGAVFPQRSGSSSGSARPPRKLPGVTIRQGTVRSLVDDEGKPWDDGSNNASSSSSFSSSARSPPSRPVRGVSYKSAVDGQQRVARAHLTIVCDGMYSNLRSKLSTPQIEAPSYFVGLILKKATLPAPSHGHVVLGDPSPVLFYPISSDEVRCLVDVPGDRLPSASTGDLARYLLEVIGPQVPPGTQAAL